MFQITRNHCFNKLYSQKEEAKGKKKKGGGGKTVSSVYLVQLTSLMNTLHQTEPHFIRCIVPNTHKQPGGVRPPLIFVSIINIVTRWSHLSSCTNSPATECWRESESACVVSQTGAID